MLQAMSDQYLQVSPYSQTQTPLGPLYDYGSNFMNQPRTFSPVLNPYIANPTLVKIIPGGDAKSKNGYGLTQSLFGSVPNFVVYGAVLAAAFVLAKRR